MAAAVGVDGDERLAGVVKRDALNGSFSTASRNSNKAHGPTGAADAEVARLPAAMTPMAPASERRVLGGAHRVARARAGDRAGRRERARGFG